MDSREPTFSSSAKTRLALAIRCLLQALLLILAALMAACATTPSPLQASARQSVDSAPRPNRIFAVGHGWHVGLVLPAAPLYARIPELKDRFNGARFLELGWGDKGFYQAQEITTSLTLQAMFWSSGAVMHVVALPPTEDPPFDYFAASDIVELCVSDREFAALIEFVSGSFLRDTENRPIVMKKGIYGDSQFYEAEGRYHFLNTCNKWVAKAIDSMGFPISPAFKLTSASVLDWMKSSERVLRESKDSVIVAPIGRAAMCMGTP